VTAGKILRELALPVDLVAPSDDWGGEQELLHLSTTKFEP
jgi:hypothetical protein